MSLRPLSLAVALGLCSLPAKAEPVSAAVMDNGALLTLHDERGPCVQGAKLAVWRSPDRTVTIPACYRKHAGKVLIAFLDADFRILPEAEFRKVLGS